MKRYDPSAYQVQEGGEVINVFRLSPEQLQKHLCHAMEALAEMHNAALEGVAAADKWMNGGEDDL